MTRFKCKLRFYDQILKADCQSEWCALFFPLVPFYEGHFGLTTRKFLLSAPLSPILGGYRNAPKRELKRHFGLVFQRNACGAEKKGFYSVLRE